MGEFFLKSVLAIVEGRHWAAFLPGAAWLTRYKAQVPGMPPSGLPGTLFFAPLFTIYPSGRDAALCLQERSASLLASGRPVTCLDCARACRGSKFSRSHGHLW